MSKALRFLGAVAVAGATVPFLGVTPASAADSAITPSTGAYFYAEGVRKPDESPIAPPNITGNETDRVAPGNLAVAAMAGREDKVSFLLFDLLDIVPGSAVTKATLTLPLVPNDPNNASFGQAPEKVVACMAGDEGFNGDDGASIQDAPARKCTAFSAAGKASADGKSYVFDITKLAAGWVDGDNDGVALTSAEGARSTPFQVVFAGADKAKLAVTYTPGAGEDELPTFDAPPPLAGGTGSADLGGGFSGGTIPAPPADSGGFGAVSPPVVTDPAPAPAPAAAPVAAPVAAPAAQAAVPVSVETLRPTNAFWLAGILLAALLALLSLIMGDPTVPVATAKPTRLSRALADRQRGTSARPAFGRAATA
ncbi:MAG: DNRLRE domain-containing protein [Actinobacteria bacterium]|nr:DNRLRE domain-containing protein [Actinomycetota bacterium]MCA1720574.1 DNRLRE domain-containing protein [Actinomycetota bacterium]